MDSHGAETEPIVGRKSLEQFNEAGRRPSPYCDRFVDVMEELVNFTLLTRGVSSYLTDRYSERNRRWRKPAASTLT